MLDDDVARDGGILGSVIGSNQSSLSYPSQPLKVFKGHLQIYYSTLKNFFTSLIVSTTCIFSILLKSKMQMGKTDGIPTDKPR